MLFPINSSNLNIILIGEPTPSNVYGTNEQKKDKKGRLLFKVPVLISGTGDKLDPTTSIVVAGPLPSLSKGQRIQFENLSILNWTMRGNDGVMRSGIVLKADSVSPLVK